MNNNQISKRSRWLSYGLIGLGVVLVLLLIFNAGFALGTRQAFRSQGPMMAGMPPTNVGFGQWRIEIPHGFAQEGHGAIGTIEAINLPSLRVGTRDGDIKTIVITSRTRIEGPTTTLKEGDLRIGQQVVTLGEPGTTTENELNAIFIRILPPPPTN